MRRRACVPRIGWQRRVEEAGLTWHTLEEPYWNESAFYEFSAAEIEILERATNELAAMSLEAAQHIIDNKLYARMGIPPSRSYFAGYQEAVLRRDQYQCQTCGAPTASTARYAIERRSVDYSSAPRR